MKKIVIKIERAKSEDTEIITEIAKVTFLDDNKLKPIGASMEGPPGHDNVEKQKKWINNCFYYKAIFNGKIVGGGLAWKENEDIFHVFGMYIEPEFQNLGIGSKLLEYMLEKHHPQKKWVLETPSFSKRNHHFYEKFGFIKIKEIANNMGWEDYYYEKVMKII